MSVRHHLSAYDRGRAVGHLEAGQSVTAVATEMGVSKSVISRLKKAAAGGNAMRKHAGGRGRNTTPQEDEYVSQVAESNRNLTPGQIAIDLATATGTCVSARTISRRLKKDGLYARKPVQWKMSAKHHLSAYDQGRAVSQLEAGQSVTTVAAVMGVSKGVISRLKKAAEGGNAMWKEQHTSGGSMSIPSGEKEQESHS